MDGNDGREPLVNSRSVHGQTQAREVLKGLQLRHRCMSLGDMSGTSPMPIDERDLAAQASRLDLDTSHHGSDDVHSSMEISHSVPLMSEIPLYQGSMELSTSPVARGVPLQAVLEKEPFSQESPGMESTLRGRSLFKDYIESQGESLSEVAVEPDRTPMPDFRTQRVEQFLRSVFGVEDSNETQKVVEFLNLGISSNISNKELVSGLEKLGYAVDEQEISVLVDIMAPGSDHVKLSQFVASQIDWESLQQTHRDSWLQCVRHAFESIDKDKDGSLSTEDIIGAIADKLPNKNDIEAALEQARAEACAAELNMSFEDFLAVLRDDQSLPLKNFDSRYNDSQVA